MVTLIYFLPSVLFSPTMFCRESERNSALIWFLFFLESPIDIVRKTYPIDDVSAVGSPCYLYLSR